LYFLTAGQRQNSTAPKLGVCASHASARVTDFILRNRGLSAF